MSSLRLQTFSGPLPKDEPYVLASDEGETITLIGSGSIMRYLTTGQESGDAFAILQTRARDDEAVPAQ
jgi:CRP-like cAMP-binding protein